MTIGERIKFLRDKAGLTQDELGQKIGTTKQTIFKYESGIVSNIPLDKLEQLAKALGANPAYLMGWEPSPSSSISGAFPYSPTRRIPILGRISAGLPLYAEQNIEGYTYIDLPGDAEYFGLIVRGDSMDAAGIKDGYTLIVRRQEDVENGDIAVVLVNGQDATVKRLYRTADMITLMPQSTNPAHMPQIYNAKDVEIRVQGKVVEVKFKP